MAIDINLLDVFGQVQDRFWKTVLGVPPADIPTNPLGQYLYLENVREQAARQLR